MNRVPVTLSAAERKTYDELKKELVVSLNGEEIDALNAASLSNKLCQLANGAIYGEDKHLKRELIAAINAVDVPEYQTVLELRYLCFKSWEEIAVQMGYSTKYLFELHGKALKKICVPQKDLTFSDRI